MKVYKTMAAVKAIMSLIVWAVYIYVAIRIALGGISSPFESWGSFISYAMIMALVAVPFVGAVIGIQRIK